MSELVTKLSKLVDGRKVPDAPIELPPVIAGIDQDVVEAADDPAADTIVEGDGQTFIIEYKGTDGETNRRRITVEAVKRNHDGVLSLAARCHESDTNRSFRIDRILKAADLDGEVHEPPGGFLADILGLDLDDVQVAGLARDEAYLAEQDRLLKLWNKSRDHVRPHAIILNALSQSDGSMRHVEVEIAIAYMGVIAPAVTTGEIEPGRIRRYVKSLRPDEKTLMKAIDRVKETCDEDQITDLILTGKRLIEADGVLEDDEIELLNMVAKELLGKEILEVKSADE